MTFDWTKESIDKLKDLWMQGLSAREIATMIDSDNLTRNAVIGKANRLSLESRSKPVEMNMSMVYEVPSERQCHWPTGHPGGADFKFCLLPVKNDKPYCPQHCRKAYRGPGE